MSQSQTPAGGAAVSRGFKLGLVVFGLFVGAAALIWALAAAVGLSTPVAFLVAACSAPLLVGGVILIWFFSLPLPRRQILLGVGTEPPDGQNHPGGSPE